MIPFNKPYFTGNETVYIQEAVKTGKISGNGIFTQKCQRYFEEKYGFLKCLLTTSCTDALEMAAILIDIKPGDEVIMPSYTFVSTANAFILRGAKIVFADSKATHPGIDEDAIEVLITPKTKAIIPVHYAGSSCEMNKIMALAKKYNLYVIEDAAQAVDGFYTANGIHRALGSIGHLAAFSFHETKNLISGEGGMLIVNDPKLIDRAEIIWEKGTNRSQFFRGEISKYEWVDIGSSFLPSEITAAFLWAQLENMNKIQQKRLELWETYYFELTTWAEKHNIALPVIPKYSTNNAHIFYLICESETQRNALIEHLGNLGILSVFHYLSLHNSPFYSQQHGDRVLSNSDEYSLKLLRLPLFFELNITMVIDAVKKFNG